MTSLPIWAEYFQPQAVPYVVAAPTAPANLTSEIHTPKAPSAAKSQKRRLTADAEPSAHDEVSLSFLARAYRSLASRRSSQRHGLARRRSELESAAQHLVPWPPRPAIATQFEFQCSQDSEVGATPAAMPPSKRRRKMSITSLHKTGQQRQQQRQQSQHLSAVPEAASEH